MKVGRGGEPLPKTFDWWGGSTAGVSVGQQTKKKKKKKKKKKRTGYWYCPISRSFL